MRFPTLHFVYLAFYSAQLVLKPNSRAGEEVTHEVGGAGDFNHCFAAIRGSRPADDGRLVFVSPDRGANHGFTHNICLR